MGPGGLRVRGLIAALLSAAMTLACGGSRASGTGPAPEPAIVPAAADRVAPPTTSTFTIDGKPVPIAEILVYGDPERAGAGAVVMIDGVLLRLPKAGHYQLETTPIDEGRILLVDKSGHRRIIGVRAIPFPRDGELLQSDPISGLSLYDLQGLWGALLESQPESRPSKAGYSLDDFDPTRTCVTLLGTAEVGEDKHFPALPPRLRCLAIWHISSAEKEDYSSLADLTELRFFAFESFTSFDARLLEGNRGLRSLDLRVRKIANPEALASLTELRQLRIDSTELADISFTRSMKRLEHVHLARAHAIDDISPLAGATALRSVDITGRGVRDLTPLGSLAHLHTIEAMASLVSRLPARPMPALRLLDIVSAPISEADVAAFSARNPECLARHDWARSFIDTTRGVDRIRVRSGSTCKNDSSVKETLFEVRDAELVARVIATLEAISPLAAGTGTCAGPTLEFYRGDEQVAALSYERGDLVTWEGVWPSSARLEPKAAQWLTLWLARAGVSGPHEALVAVQAVRAYHARHGERVLATLPAAFPASLTALLTEPSTAHPSESSFAAELSSAIARPADEIALLFGLFGLSNGGWGDFLPPDRIVLAALKKYERKALQAAARKAILSKDRRARRGAARLWLATSGPLRDWKPRDSARLLAAVVDLMQQARYYPVRIRALQLLGRWRKHLHKRQIDRRIVASLGDPEPAVRRAAVLAVGELDHQKSIPHLMALARGEEPVIRPLAPVSASELDNIPHIEASSSAATGRESSAELAFLALARMGHQPVVSLIAGQPTNPVGDIALALLGQPELLRPEHFAHDSPIAAEHAIQAVLRCQGRYGLGHAIAQLDSYDLELSAAAFQQLSSMLMVNKAPGSAQLQDAVDNGELATWYEQYGEQYVAQARVTAAGRR